MIIKKAGKPVLVKNSIKKPEMQKDGINEEIRRKAYYKFENSGRINGNDRLHWYEAEIEVAGNK
ncbi:MAG: hypothetical protein A2452_12120 [Candidatus Firestonebacteria bacterium RIFOXYC2_FULL_39_67]|nr:MAG: hypothetical protein A2536_00215 [Candidatus Firestonebacteria bacterium RIFOXYD2_FULL_39_29]OGF55713.1 MAG: hypothetical protein A2452_12120 [Candidatus Firestonebacteria bacterium RIFOXYC2_FULL_39_67]OGF57970.1 MAG: hypothetical protein A2497_02415 [Candidatus Firestonebacteria bacterium RifOxyC12_full_39_7]